MNKLDYQIRLQEYINSEDFLQLLKNINQKFRINVIWLVIEYSIIHKDLFQINEYILFLSNYFNSFGTYIDKNYFHIPDKIKFLEKTISNKLNTDNNAVIKNFIQEEFYNHGYLYHSTNEMNIDSIKTSWLDSQIRMWDWAEIKIIQEIFEKIGIYSIFGFLDINCNNKTSISDNYQSLYKYALTSPEWFNMFVSGYHIPRIKGFDDKAFYKRNYQNSKNNLLILLDSIKSNEYMNYQNNLSSDLKNKWVDTKEIFNDIIKIYQKINYTNKTKSECFYDIIYNQKNKYSEIDNKIFSSYERGFIFMKLYNMFMNNENKAVNYIINSNEKDILIKFFEKYWNMFWKGNLATILLDRKSLNLNWENDKNNYLNTNKWDYQISENINNSNFIYINLPNYSKIFE